MDCRLSGLEMDENVYWNRERRQLVLPLTDEALIGVGLTMDG